MMVTPTKMDQARRKLEEGFEALYQIPQVKDHVFEDHIAETPRRSTQAIFEMFAGCFQDPVNILDATFDSRKYDEMVYVNDISFVSTCEHHTMPFFGKVHFAYIPSDKIVGISKIPRLVECFSLRPQIQENLTQAIVDTFMEIINPFGCGAIIEAWHFCMCVRGVKQRPAYAKTCALRGSFTDGQPRQEFLNGVRKTTEQLWP